MNVRALTQSDIPQAMKLKEAAGWNQTEADWRRLIELEPEGCFAVEEDGIVAATTTVVCYGTDLAWVGMVLTLPAYRRRGFAKALIEKAIEFTTARGVRCVKLDATDLGERLYRSAGFEEECEIERWVRPPGSAYAGKAGGYAPEYELDRRAFGADRGPLLRKLSPLGAASAPGNAYAMGRIGSEAAYFGPCVAKRMEGANMLARWFVVRQGEEHPIFWDLFPENREAISVAQQLGFKPQRKLIRMTRGSLAWSRQLTYAIAGFELG